ncbi:plant-specific TFIIB-related protein PTF2-like [Juglans microcarpa x Juglans regia]|uniref:plant-specific TFIIB-related protein PTF2-like n=1 Tax=Juglans microcarpa x Juglans regia TaxID=2249226 RepID=UPI001B7DA2E1|nr:plant-specific TFIIB-related protein PTF2-like [Juglans microcarpa x Juglans regia]
MPSGSCGWTNCRSKSLIRDDITKRLVCSACGLVQEFDNFDAQLGGLNGPQGTFVRVGTPGTGTLHNYKETKVDAAQTLIESMTFSLGLSSSKSNDVKTMIATITENEFGQGDWFPILIGACAYVVMIKDNKLLSIAEVASIIGCNIFELGRMVSHVVDFLDLKGLEEFPEFDIVAYFQRTMRNSPRFTGVRRDKVARMLKQGIFLIQCAERSPT